MVDRRQGGAEMPKKVEIKPLQVEVALDDGSTLRLKIDISGEIIAPGEKTLPELFDQNGLRVYGGYKRFIVDMFLKDLDHFLKAHPEWGEISLLKAAGMDHRLFNRIRAGEGFRIDTLDQIASTMNLVTIGAIDPSPYRNLKKAETA